MRILLVILLLVGLWWGWSAFFRVEPPPLPGGVASLRLTSAEQEYYRQTFDYVMDYNDPGKAYLWETQNGHGKITAFKSFASKSQSICRNFSETLTIDGKETETGGIACKREGREGWCRLQKGQALTCAMEPPDNIVDMTVRGAGDVMNTGASIFKSWLPF